MLNCSRPFVFDVVLQSVVGEHLKGFHDFFGGVGRGKGGKQQNTQDLRFFWKILDFIAQKWCSSVVPEQVILDARLRIPVWRAFRPAVNI